ncbi:MAG TPA: hypothetical protein VNK95_08695 [Caldilineaceae bacterium]|nr:hypothetical protein [Caldilineaceae bacterium]
MTTFVAWIALVVALAAVGYAWKLSLELATATRRLDRYNRALFDANDEIRRLREQMEEETARLRVELRRRDGAAFTPEMTVREALLLHPQAEQVLAGFHLGGCSHCAVEPDETLAQVCAQHDIPVERLVGHLNRLIPAPVSSGPANGSEPQRVKLPNVALEF